MWWGKGEGGYLFIYSNIFYKGKSIQQKLFFNAALTCVYICTGKIKTSTSKIKNHIKSKSELKPFNSL